MALPKPPERTFVGECTEGCTWTGTAARLLGVEDGAPRLLEEEELNAHDDEHLSDAARPIVRTLRTLDEGTRAEVLGYFRAGRKHASAKGIRRTTIVLGQKGAGA